MPLTIRQTIAPTNEPISVADLKSHLRIDIADEDAVLGRYVEAARVEVEQYLRRQLLPATWTLYLDAWPSRRQAIRLPRPPTASVTSVQYYDSAGSLQTLSSAVYQVDVISEPARICLADGQTWPSLQAGRINAIVITYVAGWTTAWAVPANIRHAIAMLAGDLYEHREAQLDLGNGLSSIEENAIYMRMLWKYRILDLP